MPYTPPAGNAVNFNFSGAYTPPSGVSVTFNFGAGGGGGAGNNTSNIRSLILHAFYFKKKKKPKPRPRSRKQYNSTNAFAILVPPPLHPKPPVWKQWARKQYLKTHKPRLVKVRIAASTIIQYPIRVTWSGLEVPNTGDAQVRVTWSGLEVASTGDSAARVTWSGLEIASSLDLIPQGFTFWRSKEIYRLWTTNKQRKSRRRPPSRARSIVIPANRPWLFVMVS